MSDEPTEQQLLEVVRAMPVEKRACMFAFAFRGLAGMPFTENMAVLERELAIAGRE